MNRFTTASEYLGRRVLHLAVHACGSCSLDARFALLEMEAKMHVIARGYGDEPLDRATAGIEGDVVFIVNPAVNRPVDNLTAAGVGFPTSCVFEYSESLWRDLSDAWARADLQRLQSLWSQATPVSAMSCA